MVEMGMFNALAILQALSFFVKLYSELYSLKYRNIFILLVIDD